MGDLLLRRAARARPWPSAPRRYRRRSRRSAAATARRASRGHRLRAEVLDRGPRRLHVLRARVLPDLLARPVRRPDGVTQWLRQRVPVRTAHEDLGWHRDVAAEAVALVPRHGRSPPPRPLARWPAAAPRPPPATTSSPAPPPPRRAP